MWRSPWDSSATLSFRADEVRLLLEVIAYNLGNLLRRLALPLTIKNWSLTNPPATALQDRGAPHPACAYIILQLAESHLTPRLFRQILGRIERLALPN